MSETVTGAHAELAVLRRFDGVPKEFWPRFVAALADLGDADRCVVAAKGGPEGATWSKLQDWAHNELPAGANAIFQQRLIEFAERATVEGSTSAPLSSSGVFLIAVRLPLANPAEVCVALLLISGSTEAVVREVLVRVQLAADVPNSYLESRNGVQARADTRNFATTLDTLTGFNEQTRFFGASLALCNAVATCLRCERVSLGWLAGPSVKLRAISRTEKFNRQMAAAQALEIAMEEALDQDADLLFPPPEDYRHITRDHETFAREQRVSNLASFPLRVGGAAVGCLTAERSATPFTDLELQQFRLTVDLVARRLAELQARDRWFGARWMAGAKMASAKLLGPTQTWAKVLGLLASVAILLLVFLRVNYRVEGTFSLRADDLAYLSVPFEGYLAEVLVRPGDTVTNGQPLLRLDVRDLLLEESGALADITRYQREAEKNRAARALADMRIAQSLADQAQARLDLIHHRLDQATVRAPFDGVVVEGDLRDRLGVPLKQGDTLFRVAKLRGLYVQAEVSEQDVHEIPAVATGQIAFYSQPRLKFPIHVLALEPVAVTREKGNVFLLRCALGQPTEAWFRPGMSGVIKLNVGQRRLIWILSHRTIDFLRLFFWW